MKQGLPLVAARRRTRAWALSLWLAGVVLGVQAADPAPPSVQAERARIAAERSRLTERFTAENRACHQRFAVNDCLNANRARQREAMDDLRRQEVLVNDSERLRKAGDQMRKLDEKQEARDADAASRPPASPPAAPRAAPEPPPGKLPRTAPPRAPDAQRIEQHEESMRRKQERHTADQARRAGQAGRAEEEADRTADRVREAQEHKARTLERNAAKPSTAQPLPPPP